MQEIETAEALTDAEEARKRLQGLIETFQDKTWAVPAVERARKAIEPTQSL